MLILGMGPGLSKGVAERFGLGGYRIGMISRNESKLSEFKNQLDKLGITSLYTTADLTDTEQMKAAMSTLRGQLGPVSVLFYNAVDYRMTAVLDDNIEQLTKGFRINVGHALLATQLLLNDLEQNKGAVLLTGGAAANRPDPQMASISLGKAGIRNLAYQLSEALSPKGVYVGTLTIAGWINENSKTHSPKILAELFWNMHLRRNETEVTY